MNQCTYKIEYLCKSKDKTSLNMGHKELYSLCLDIAKKIKNANCESKMYISSSGNRLSFEAETQHLTPLDFVRIVFQFSSDHLSHKLLMNSTLMMPNLVFTCKMIPSMKFHLCPLSKLLLNKMSE